MVKRQIKLFVLLFALVFVMFCFAGCKNSKDVYGAASEFIKVSHPEKPNINVFSDDSYDEGNKTDSKTDSSDKTSSSSSSSESSEKQNSSKSSTSSEESQNSNGGGNIVSTPLEGDFSPIVKF